jgi:uncharacterized protein (TIGR03437 family)
MRFFLLLSMSILLREESLHAQPVIATAALHDASSAPASLPNSAIAPGGRFYLFGQGLGPSTAARSQDGARELGGTSVRVAIGGQTVDARLLYVSSRELIAFLPRDTPLGQGSVSVTFDGLTSARPAPIVVAKNSFGLYTRNNIGSGPADALNIANGRDFDNTVLSPAPADSRISLIGTGIGLEEPPVEVLIGGKTVAPRVVDRYANGLDEIIFDLPEGLKGCYVPVAVRVAGLVSNYGTIAVDSGEGRCGDDFGIPESAWTRIKDGGTFRTGTITPNRFRSGNLLDDAIRGSFVRLTADELLLSWGPLGAPSPGYCTVVYTADSSLPADPIDPQPISGGTLTLAGPRRSISINPNRNGFYSLRLGDERSPFFEPGEYALSNGRGGLDVGQISSKLTIGEPFQWTNESEVPERVARNQDLVVKWSGTKPDDDVLIYGGGAPDSGGGAMFICSAKGGWGEFTVPAQILASLPKLDFFQSTDSGDFGGAIWLVRAPALAKSAFTAEGLDVGYFYFQELLANTFAFE